MNEKWSEKIGSTRVNTPTSDDQWISYHDTDYSDVIVILHLSSSSPPVLCVIKFDHLSAKSDNNRF